MRQKRLHNVSFLVTSIFLTVCIIGGTIWYLRSTQLWIRSDYAVMNKIGTMRILNAEMNQFLERKLTYTNNDDIVAYLEKFDTILTSVSNDLTENHETTSALQTIKTVFELKKEAIDDHKGYSAIMNNSLSYIYVLAQKINATGVDHRIIYLTNELLNEIAKMGLQKQISIDKLSLISKELQQKANISEPKLRALLLSFLAHTALIQEKNPLFDQNLERCKNGQLFAAIDTLEKIVITSFHQKEQNTHFVSNTLLGASSVLLLGLVVLFIRDLKLRRELVAFRRAIETSDNIIMITDSDGIIEYVNDSFERISGYTKEEAQGQKTSLLNSGKQTHEFYIELWKTLKNGNKWSGEFINRRKDGTFYYQKSTLTPIVDDKTGKVKNFVAVGLDVTHEKELVDSLGKFNEELELRVHDEVEKNRHKDAMLLQQSRLAIMGEMISVIAHQWRQPLNALGVLVQDVQDAYNFEELDEAYIQHFQNHSMELIYYMSKTIDDFRDFTKPNRTKENFDIKLVAHEALRLMQGVLEKRTIHVTINFPTDPILITGYKNEMLQVILNLLNNAKDALSEHQSIHNRHLLLTLSLRDTHVVFSIEDNGGGIPEEIMDHIFDPYFTTKGVQGTGIGLYMAKMIIERNMQGKLTARNINKGAELIITLPL